MIDTALFIIAVVLWLAIALGIMSVILLVWHLWFNKEDKWD